MKAYIAKSRATHLKSQFVALCAATLFVAPAVSAEILAHWRFEEIQLLDGSRISAAEGQSLTGRDHEAVAPRPYAYDSSGNGNVLQVWEPADGSNPSGTVFSTNVPVAEIDGAPNGFSLALRGRDYFLLPDKPLAAADLGKSWTISAMVMTRRLNEAQVFIGKERTTGMETTDLAIGYDSASRAFYVEVKGRDGALRRLHSPHRIEAGSWYSIEAAARYDSETDKSNLTFDVRRTDSEAGTGIVGLTYPGRALPTGTARWVIGRMVQDGGIDEVVIRGEALPRVPGENPIFRNVFNADPAPLVVGDTVYVYVGHDMAGEGEMFTMPSWLVYSSQDMINWTAHGPVMFSDDFEWAEPNSAWASEVIEHNGKFYFYTTVRFGPGQPHVGSAIGVAVSDSPTGPFVDAIGTALINDSMTPDARRPWNDIDPTTFIDDDGTPWMSWGNGDCYLVRLKPNMIEIDGEIINITPENFTEGPWFFKRDGIYYNIYAAQEPRIVPEQIAYATATEITGPWTYRGIITGPAANSFTIHPGVIEFNDQWYFFYHHASHSIDGVPGAIGRRAVCVEYLYFNADGSIQPIMQTTQGVTVPPRKPSEP